MFLILRCFRRKKSKKLLIFFGIELFNFNLQLLIYQVSVIFINSFHWINYLSNKHATWALIFWLLSCLLKYLRNLVWIGWTYSIAWPSPIVLFFHLPIILHRLLFFQSFFYFILKIETMDEIELMCFWWRMCYKTWSLIDIIGIFLCFIVYGHVQS